MTQSDIGIVEKLERTEFEPGSSRAPYQRLINPDGPEAAAIIMEMVEALEEIKRRVHRARTAASPVDAMVEVGAIDDLCDTIIAKVSGK